MRQTGEPSVDEILESIKKVIARDNRASSAEQRRIRETSGVAAGDTGETARNAAIDDEDDVLDLAVSAQFIDGRADDPADDTGDDAMAEDEPAEAPLVTDGARASMRESLAALAMLAQPGSPPQIVRSGETSLEGLVRDLLRPALAEWLDKNLPAMVERLVAAEIAKIVGKRG